MRYITLAAGIITLGIQSLALAYVGYQRRVVEQEVLRLGNYVMELEARLPCPPTFELVCGFDEQSETGLYRDGIKSGFRYALNGADLGPVHCFMKDGTEVRP